MKRDMGESYILKVQAERLQKERMTLSKMVNEVEAALERERAARQAVEADIQECLEMLAQSIN